MKTITWVSDAAHRLRTWLAGLRSPLDMNDAHAYGGLLMLGYGLQQVHPAAGWVACGLVLLWLGVRR